MTAREGMAGVITEWRALVGDVGTATISDDRAQQILDDYRVDFYQEKLTVTPLEVSGSVVYKVFQSGYEHLEGTASGTVAFRVYDSNGSAITPDTIDTRRGLFRFNADQSGSARYFDGRSYDLNGAAAQGWREMAGKQSSLYDFRQEGRQFSRSQWFAHCKGMAEYYDSMRRVFSGQGLATIERSDM